MPALRHLLAFLLTPALAAQTYLHHQSWTTEDGLPQNTVHQILQTPDGYLWIATEAGLARFDGTTFRTYNHLTDPALTSDDIAALALGPTGTLLITTTDATLRLTHGHIERTGTPPPPALSIPAWTPGLPGTRIESLSIDRTGTTWIGTNDGLAILPRGAATPTLIPALAGNAISPPSKTAKAITGSAPKPPASTSSAPSSSAPNPPSPTAPSPPSPQTSDGAIWAGTRTDGVRRLQNGLTTQPVASAKLTSPIILSLAPGPHGTLWAGTPDGLNRIDPTGHIQQITSAEGLPDDYIQALQPAPDGTLWIGTRQGLVHLRERTPMETLTKTNGLPGDLIGSLFLGSDGDLWIGTSGGLARRHPNGAIATQKDAPQGIVNAIAQDPTGTLWIATLSHGLTRFSRQAFTTVPTIAEPILGLAADNQGALWLRKEHGIQRLLLADLNRCADTGHSCPAPADYGLADGLPTTESASSGSPVIARTTTGELWFATRRGVAITDPAYLPLNPIPPPVALQHFLVDDSPIDLARSHIDIPPGHTRYTIEYAALSFTAPSEVRYRFKLEGLDQTWTEATAPRRSATYTNLPPGPYIFHVQAANNDGVWNDQGATLNFSVVPPFYRRLWFLALATLAALGLSILLYRLRLRFLQSRFDATLQERNRVAREIHDTLAQDFVGVSLQLDIVSHLLRGGKVEPAITQVAQTRQLVTEGLAEARRSIWELRANLSADSLPARLAKAVERYSGEACKVRLRIGGAYRKLPQRTEDEILRIAAESLSNIHRHAQATAASVHLAYAPYHLTLTVANDGKGFDPQSAALTGHYGVTGMHERAKSIAATLHIQAAPSQGTTLTLTIPASEQSTS